MTLYSFYCIVTVTSVNSVASLVITGGVLFLGPILAILDILSHVIDFDFHCYQYKFSIDPLPFFREALSSKN